MFQAPGARLLLIAEHKWLASQTRFLAGLRFNQRWSNVGRCHIPGRNHHLNRPEDTPSLPPPGLAMVSLSSPRVFINPQNPTWKQEPGHPFWDPPGELYVWGLSNNLGGESRATVVFSGWLLWKVSIVAPNNKPFPSNHEIVQFSPVRWFVPRLSSTRSLSSPSSEGMGPENVVKRKCRACVRCMASKMTWHALLTANWCRHNFTKNNRWRSNIWANTRGRQRVASEKSRPMNVGSTRGKAERH